MLDLVRNPPQDDAGWTPSKLALKKRAHCLQHGQMYLRLNGKVLSLFILAVYWWIVP